MDILNGCFLKKKVTRKFRMYTYRIRGKRGPFKIILPDSFGSFLFLLDAIRHVRFSAIIFRLPIFLFVHEQEDSCTLPLATPKYCQVLFIFFFPGRLCRNRYCTFPDFQNRFDNICPYCLPVCPPARRHFSDPL